MQPFHRYKIFFEDAYSSDYIIWSKIIDQSDCLPFEEDDQYYMAFSSELEYFKTCEPICKQLNLSHVHRSRVEMNVYTVESGGFLYDFGSSICDNLHETAEIVDLHNNDVNSNQSILATSLNSSGLSLAKVKQPEKSTVQTELNPTTSQELNKYSLSETIVNLTHISNENMAIPGRNKDAFSLQIILPARNELEHPFDISYTLLGHERGSRCGLRALNVSIDSQFYMRVELARGVCGREAALILEPPPPAGAHTLSLTAIDAAGAVLATATADFNHLGPGLQDDPDALCLLSYSQSGNHLLRFIIEYLTARPTVGCRGNLIDLPIHTNSFPPPHRPLAHVDPLAPPAAHKFHYALPALSEMGCALAEGAPQCRRLVLLVRDFAACIPRFFEGMKEFAEKEGLEEEEERSAGTIVEQAALYLGNLRAFAGFRGPRLLVRYEALVANRSEAAAVAAFLAAHEGPAEAAELGRRAEALQADYEGLLGLSRAATGRSWMGVRRASGSYLAGWSDAEMCVLGTRFEEELPGLVGDGDGADGGLLEALAGYEGSVKALTAACQSESV
jgi:hypothetical protein